MVKLNRPAPITEAEFYWQHNADQWPLINYLMAFVKFAVDQEN